MENENKKNRTLLFVILALIVGAATGTTATLAAIGNRAVDITVDADGGNGKISYVWQLLKRHYVDPIDNDSITDRLCSTLLSTLDPHSYYLTSKEVESENEALRGNFEGIGTVLRKYNDTICAWQILDGSPSATAGLQAADRLVEVDGHNITGKNITIDSAVKMIRGPRRSNVDIKISRHGEPQPRIITLTRDIIPTPSASYSGMLDKTTGYIHLDRFAETTYDEFCNAVNSLKSKGMKSLIIDLRNNGGGLLSAAIDICDELLPGRELIVYTEGAHQRRREEHSRPGGLFCEGKLTIMIDEFSASASEIVAGAIQDNDRGTIVGRRSFGKGLVQQQYALPDQSAARITIARYYTPSGRCIQRPYDRGTDEYYTDFIQNLMDEYQNDSLLSRINDSTPYYTTNGRIVYGGGGIYPDHTIHYKSDENIVYYNQLINKGIIDDYAFDIVSDEGRKIKSTYPDGESFIKNYAVSEAMLQALYARGEKKGLKRDNKCINLYRNEIQSRLKAEIGIMLYSQSVFYEIQILFDPEIREAVSIMNKKK